MNGNFYDIDTFYENYKQLRHDKFNANDTIEKPYLLRLLPDIKNKTILDLGCGTGSYIIELMKDAKSIDAVDISQKMLDSLKNEASKKMFTNINVINSSIEGFDFPQNKYDIALSTLAFHYIRDLDITFSSINASLKEHGHLIFSVEHPILTATRNIGWEVRENGDYEHWRLDNYFETGIREYDWLGAKVVKYHRTVEDFVGLLKKNGFQIIDILEPRPKETERKYDKETDGHFRRPIFLMFSAIKI